MLNINTMPSPELAYILGVLDGDGYVCNEGRGNYKTGLNTIDIEFAQAFSSALKKIGFNSNIYENFAWGRGGWIAYGYSKNFYVWHCSLTEEIKSNIVKSFSSMYLKGAYDSDGNLYFNRGKYPSVSIYNTNKKLLIFIKNLLINLNIVSYIYLIHKAGYTSFIKEKPVISRKDLHVLRIASKDIKKFMRLVGSSIPRKVIKN